MTRLRGLVALALAGSLLCTAACGDAERGAAAPPTQAPLRLRVNDIAGAAASMDAYRGRVVVLNVWATWCGPCRRELPSLDRLNRRLDESRFAVVGVALDADRVAVREYLEQNGIRFAQYVAADSRELQSELAIRSLPQTLIIRADGTVAERIGGARDWDSDSAVATIDALLTRGGDARPGGGHAAPDGPVASRHGDSG